MQIPKVIHYCWFGGNPLPDEYKNYIESWKKFLPDWEIKRWDESNFDFNECEYVKEAYNAKKWAFVSDYARIKIIYENGGIYFDTDVELIKPIDDIIEKGAFMALEKMDIKRGAKNDKVIGINLGLGFGSPAKLGVYEQVLDYYKDLHFVRPDGSYDQTTIVEHVSGIFNKLGYDGTDTMQTVAGVNLYPSEYFSPIDCATGKKTLTDNTVSIHHYSASWADDKLKLKNKIKKLLGPAITGFVISIKRLLKKEK